MGKAGSAYYAPLSNPTAAQMNMAWNNRNDYGGYEIVQLTIAIYNQRTNIYL